jgi:peptidoglycan hydrolase CwlO-like protein
MDGAALSAIAVALITTVGGVMVALINSLRKENRKDHNTVTEKLEDLKEDIKDLDEKIDSHITWHLDNK